MAWRLSQRDHIQSNSRPHFVIRSCCWLAPNCCWWWNTVFCSVDFKDMLFNLLTLCYLTKKIPRAKIGGKTVRKQMTRNFFSSNHKVDILNYVVWRVNRTQCDVGICGGAAAAWLFLLRWSRLPRSNIIWLSRHGRGNVSFPPPSPKMTVENRLVAGCLLSDFYLLYYTMYVYWLVFWLLESRGTISPSKSLLLTLCSSSTEP